MPSEKMSHLHEQKLPFRCSGAEYRGVPTPTVCPEPGRTGGARCKAALTANKHTAVRRRSFAFRRAPQ
jgi:hypothetical protein